MINGLKSHLPLLVQAICLLGLFLFGLTMDIAAGISLYWTSVGLMAVFGLIFTLPHLFTAHRRRAFGLFCVYLFAFLCLRFLPLSSVKTYRQFHHAVANGMTAQEVNALYNGYFPKHGRFPQPILSVFENPSSEYIYTTVTDTPDKNFHYILDTENYNGEWVDIYFKNGKVVGKEYSMD